MYKRQLYGLVRSRVGFVMLDRIGCAGLAARVRGDVAVGQCDLIGRLTHRRNPMRARAEADMRRLAIARVARPFLRWLLRDLAGACYLNVGHANLTERVLRSVHRAGLGVAVLVHDTIPLDHPDFARPGTVKPFRAKMAAVACHADPVSYTHLDVYKRQAVGEPSWLTRLTAPFADAEVIAATGFVRGRNGISFQWQACEVDALAQDHPFDASATVLRAGTALRAVKTQGTNCAFRASALRAVGGRHTGPCSAATRSRA